jgi:hypothetical protein
MAWRSRCKLKSLFVSSLILAKFHDRSYAAFCRNYGEYQTRSQPYRCWNEEAIGGMVNDMSRSWGAFIVVLEDRLHALVESFEETLQEAADLAFDAGV